MSKTSHHPSTLPENLGDWHDQALQRAHDLRREAIDDFWRGADAAFISTLASARRGAQRLAYRLRRHAWQRATQRDAMCTRRGGE